MVIHPPMLYMGYVGFSVAFAFAIAALLGGRLDATWARWSRPWTTAAWSFLTIGIALGSWWAYYELGWGGWWFWDPVENASFMPWLVGTALAALAGGHREARHVQELDGAARDRRVLAVAARHVPRALGRAHVGARVRDRSGARRVHPGLPGDRDRRLAHAVRDARGRGRRRRGLRAGVARVAAAGQQHPARRRAARACCSARCIRCSSTRSNLRKISVGPPYFDAVFSDPDGAARVPDGHRPDRELAPGGAAGPVDAPASGRSSSPSSPRCCCRSRMGAGRRWSRSGCSSRCGSSRRRSPPSCSACATRRNAGSRAKLAANPAAWYGMVLAHLGVAVFIVGVTMVKGYGIEQNVTLDVGQTRHRRRLRVHVPRRRAGHRPELPRRGGHRRSAPRRQAR